MVNTVNSACPGVIQCHTKFTAPKQLSKGTCLQASQYDKLELSQAQGQVTLDAPDEITIEIPRVRYQGSPIQLPPFAPS